MINAVKFRLIGGKPMSRASHNGPMSPKLSQLQIPSRTTVTIKNLSLVAVLFLFLWPQAAILQSTHADGPTLWLAPTLVRPARRVHSVLHIRDLRAGSRIAIAVLPPWPRMGVVSYLTARVNSRGGVDQPISFPGLQEGDYTIWVDRGRLQAPLDSLQNKHTPAYAATARVTRR